MKLAKMNRDKIMIFVFLAIAIGIVAYFKTIDDNKHFEESLIPLEKNIAATGRPRIIFFTARNCPVCQQYKPVIEKVVKNYSRSVDCEIIDIRNDSNNKMVQLFLIKALPSIFIFNKQGNLIFKHRGEVGFEELDKNLRNTVI